MIMTRHCGYLQKAGLVVPLLVLAMANTAAVKAPTVADGVVCRETCFDLYMAELTNCKSVQHAFLLYHLVLSMCIWLCTHLCEPGIIITNI